MCILCYGIGRVALLHRERQPFWNVFTEIFSLPYWHLFGELDLDEDSAGECNLCTSLLKIASVGQTDGIEPAGVERGMLQKSIFTTATKECFS